MSPRSLALVVLFTAAALSSCAPARPAGGEGEGEGEGSVAGEGEGEGSVAGEGEGEGSAVSEGEGEGEGSVVVERPAGQCRVDDDCPTLSGVASCNRNVPGGTCRCGDAFRCPSTSTCNDFGVCLQDCAVDDDCPSGMFCGSQGCLASSCSGACDDPAYACDASTSRCRRFTCAEGCPSGWGCVQGLCVEP